MKTMKKLLAVVLTVVMLFSTFVFTASASSNYTRVIIEGIELSFATDPVVVNGTVCVPMQQIYTLFNAKVVVDEEDYTIIITTPDDVKIVMQVGEPVAKVGTEMKELKVAPYILNNEIFVPIDLVADSLNIAATYDAEENLVEMKRNPKLTKLNLAESVYFSTSSSGAETGKAVLNPTGQKNLYRNYPRADYFAKIDISSIEKASAANFYFSTVKFNNAANIAIYELTAEEYATFAEVTAEGVEMKCEKLPAGKQVAAKSYSATSSGVSGGFTPDPIDITEYVASKIAAGEDTLYFRLTNISGGTSTTDNTRMINFHTKAYVEITTPPGELSFEGMKQYITNVYDYTPSTLRTSLATNGALYSSALNRHNAGKELNTFGTYEGFRPSNMYYIADIKSYEGNLSNAFLTLNARATVDGTLNVYLVRDDKLVSNKIPQADAEPISTTKVTASSEYGQIRVDVRECLTQLDGKVAVKLEFVPDEAIRQMPCFYVFSANSEKAPTVTIISKIEK